MLDFEKLISGPQGGKDQVEAYLLDFFSKKNRRGTAAPVLKREKEGFVFGPGQSGRSGAVGTALFSDVSILLQYTTYDAARQTLSS